MNRRSFFKRMVVGGVAAAATQWPFRVYSFPREIVIPQSVGPVTIRFVRTFDVNGAKFTNHWDVLYGWGKVYPENKLNLVVAYVREADLEMRKHRDCFNLAGEKATVLLMDREVLTVSEYKLGGGE